MGKCLLCLQNDADKTGSHIIPSFLMKRVNGEGKRDHEIGFMVKNGISSTYFGRDVYEEKRRTITDNEQKLYSRENYDVKDYIFCKHCEELLASLESKYAQSVNLAYSSKSNIKNTKVTSVEAMLFWCSIVWRVSVTEHLGSRLQKDLEERLRVAIITNNIEGLNVSYALFRCKDYAKKTENGTCVCMDIADKSILLFVDDYMLVMVFDLDDDAEFELFGIGLTLKKNTLNTGDKLEEISPLPIDVFTNLIFSVERTLITNMQIPEKIQELHTLIFRQPIPKDILCETLERMLTTGKLGDKYTVEHYVMCYKEVLKKHGLIIENNDNTFRIVKDRK